MYEDHSLLMTIRTLVRIRQTIHSATQVPRCQRLWGSAKEAKDPTSYTSHDGRDLFVLPSSLSVPHALDSTFLCQGQPIMTFQALPPEIQLPVARELDPADKVNLMYTCRYFYELVTPLLYEALPDAKRYSERLVDSLVRNPALRNYPRYIRLEACYVRGPDEEEDDESAGDNKNDIEDILTGKEDEDDPTTWLHKVPLQTQYAKEVCTSESDGDLRLMRYVTCFMSVVCPSIPRR
jgi:hypothetical protein